MRKHEMLPFILAGAAIIFIAKKISDSNDNYEKEITKKYAILGMRSTGKTQLSTYLSTGKLPTESVQTLYINKTAKRTTEVDGKKIIIDESFDVAGDDSAHDDWIRIVKKSNIVIYLIRLDNYFEDNQSPEYFRRIKRDLALIAENLNAMIANHVFIVGTYLDKIKETQKINRMDSFRGSMPQNIQEHIAKTRDKTELTYLFARLNTERGAKELVENIHQQIDNKKSLPKIKQAA